jgi:hypothetical protein
LRAGHSSDMPFHAKRSDLAGAATFKWFKSALRKIITRKSEKGFSKMHSTLPDVPDHLKRCFPFFLHGPEENPANIKHLSSREANSTNWSDDTEDLQGYMSSDKYEMCGRITIEELINATDIRLRLSEKHKHIAKLAASGSKPRFSRRVHQLKCNRRPHANRTSSRFSMMEKYFLSYQSKRGGVNAEF